MRKRSLAIPDGRLHDVGMEMYGGAEVNVQMRILEALAGLVVEGKEDITLRELNGEVMIPAYRLLNLLCEMEQAGYISLSVCNGKESESLLPCPIARLTEDGKTLITGYSGFSSSGVSTREVPYLY